MDEQEYQAALDAIQEAQHSASDGERNLSGSDYLSDDVRYTDSIIRDDVHKQIARDGILERLFLKRRTASHLSRLSEATTTYEVVLNNYKDRDIFTEKLGTQMNALFIMAGVSALEQKYCDVISMLIQNDVHHRTKVTRGRGGFERGTQRTTITKTKSEARVGQTESEQPKSGISRYVHRRN